jgi:hypothetical protein
MSTWLRSRGMLIGVTALFVLDMMLLGAISSFIRHLSDFRCGTGAMSAATKVVFYSGVSLPVAIYVLWRYLCLRSDLTPLARFGIRLPLVCFVGLMLTFYVALPLITSYV